jgi:hypothetical protein
VSTSSGKRNPGSFYSPGSDYSLVSESHEVAPRDHADREVIEKKGEKIICIDLDEWTSRPNVISRLDDLGTFLHLHISTVTAAAL